VVNFKETTSPVSVLISDLPEVPLLSDTSTIAIFSEDPYKVGNNTVKIKPYYSSHPEASDMWADAGVVVYYVYI